MKTNFNFSLEPIKPPMPPNIIPVITKSKFKTQGKLVSINPKVDAKNSDVVTFNGIPTILGA